jgi:MYXO-CTERM domain-containing protein
VYMASTGCHQGSDCDYDIWLHEIGAGSDNRVRIIESPGFDGYPQLHVGAMWQPSAEPRLLVTPSRVTFLATTGGALTPQTLAIKNDGAGTLGAATAMADPGATWLDVKQEGTTITLSVREGTVITRGNRCTNLTIDVPGAQGSPVVVPVTLFGDETFPGSDAGVPDASVDFLADGGMSMVADASVEPGTPVAHDASGAFDCDALAAPPAPPVDAGATGPFPMGKASSGCGCRLGAGQSSAWSLLALLGLLGLRRRRR